MRPEILFAFIAFSVFGLILLARLRKRRERNQPKYENEREEQLTRRVAAQARCSLGAALESVRQELGYSPQQSDDVLVKRAVYHYNQAHPTEHKVTYCDRVRG
jgi:hypothetical protein